MKILRIGAFWRTANLSCHFMVARLLFFSYCRCKAVSFQGYHKAEKRGMEIVKVKMPQNLFLSLKFSYFSRINISRIVVNI